MSVSDVLRRLLIEAGVEYVAEDEPSVGLHFTSWDAGGFMWEADDRDERIYLSADRLITPEQTIEATLGRGTCRKVRVHMQIEDEMHCSECGRFIGFVGDISAPPYYYCPNCGRKVVDE